MSVIEKLRNESHAAKASDDQRRQAAIDRAEALARRIASGEEEVSEDTIKELISSSGGAVTLDGLHARVNFYLRRYQSAEDLRKADELAQEAAEMRAKANQLGSDRWKKIEQAELELKELKERLATESWHADDAATKAEAHCREVRDAAVSHLMMTAPCHLGERISELESEKLSINAAIDAEKQHLSVSWNTLPPEHYGPLHDERHAKIAQHRERILAIDSQIAELRARQLEV